jgi:hypothetical protein
MVFNLAHELSCLCTDIYVTKMITNRQIYIKYGLTAPEYRSKERNERIIKKSL